MKISNAFLDELRTRLLPSEVIKKKVNLKSKNGREFNGLCPFHKEKTPSFTVSDEKGFYHCFGCGAHGDIVSFAMKQEGLSFVDAVQKLAEQAGIQMPKMSKDEIEKEKKALSLIEVIEQACKWYEEQLNTAQAKVATDYLKKRGIQANTIKKFRLGFAPNKRIGLKEFLNKQNIKDKTLLEAGLIIKPDSGDPYDRFRNRIIFPIINRRNKVIAFGGRILSEGQPKYLNSPETSLFNKSDILYNEPNARSLAYKTGKLVVAEGYMDVIAMDMAGIKTGVAPLGTALTSLHVQHLWRMAKEPVLCFDGDNAGKKAIERAAKLSLPLLKPGYTIKFALLPNGQDPDDIIKNEGVGALRKYLQKATPLSEMLWNIETSSININIPESKAAIAHNLMESARKITDQTVANYYREFFKQKLWETKIQPKKKPEKIFQNQNHSNINLSSKEGCEKSIVNIILKSPELLLDQVRLDEFINIEFSSNILDKIRTVILEVCHHEDKEINQETLISHLEKETTLYNIYNKNILTNENKTSILQAQKSFDYIICNYNILNLKNELKTVISSFSNEKEKNVNELSAQIVMLENKLNNMRNNFTESEE